MPLFRLCRLLAPALLAALAPYANAAGVDRADVGRALTPFVAYVEESMAAWRLRGAAIGIVHGDDVVLLQGFGSRGVADRRPVDADTVFPIGSITKSFTGVMLAQAVDRGLVRFDTRVVDVDARPPDGSLPGYRFALSNPAITARMEMADLLAQSSGLPAYSLSHLPELGYRRNDIVAAIRHVPLAQCPAPDGTQAPCFRTRFNYVNSLHSVAANVIARGIGAADWEAAVHAMLLAPLAMQASGATRAHFEAAANRIVPTFVATLTGDVHDIPLVNLQYVLGAAGGINSSARDLTHYLRMLVDGGTFDGRRIVSEENLARIWEGRVSVGDGDVHQYGIGWTRTRRPDGRFLHWHTGGLPGISNVLLVEPESRLGIVVLTNQSEGNEFPLQAAMRFMDLVLGGEDAQAAARARDEAIARQRQKREAFAAVLRAPEGARPPAPSARYVATFHDAIYGDIEVRVREGRLAMRIGPARTRLRLLPYDGDKFLAVYAEGPLVQAGEPWVGFVTFHRDGARVRNATLEFGELVREVARRR